MLFKARPKGGTMQSQSLERMVEDKIRKWQTEQRKKYKNPIRPVITVSRLPGAKGGELTRNLAQALGIDFYDQEIVHAIAQNSNVSRRIVEALDEQDRSIFDDWIALLSKDRIWSYEYLQHLTNIVLAIGTHGYAIILGRGASYILPKEVSLRVLIVAPLEKRISNFVEANQVSEKEARQEILRIESERKAFIRKYFQAELTEPSNYDLVINTENIDVDLAAQTIREVFNSRHWYNYEMRK